MEDIKRAVRETYGQIATRGGGCCAPSCCTPDASGPEPGAQSRKLGYSDDDVTGVPEGANLGLGCGNPQAIAGLRPGESVLDLGSGGGFDCFLAAKQVGDGGRVIGVDMTAEMVALARDNAAKAGTSNVEFRLGEIEHLPVADDEIDVIMSNCVINLSPDKPAVFREALRVLKPGGRLAISDVVATRPLPEALRNDLAAVAGCIGGAALVDEVEAMLHDAGFVDVRVDPVVQSREVVREWDPSGTLDQFIVSATIEATKPA